MITQGTHTNGPSPSDDGDTVHLLLPEGDEPEPEVSIVIPAVNEESTILEVVEWCREGLRIAHTRGEVLIVDSSDDRTPDIAQAAGARVLKTPRRGLGRAYIDALPYVRGKYIVMGDADCTYDFRQIAPFVESLRQGNDFAMGSRWRGSIEPGSMPPLHQYFGTPLTTWILNRLYASRFSDIHCGMRAITREALTRMGLTSQSWEYASEMVLKSVRMNLRIDEVPVTFYKDRNGRLSHHKRAGWLSPFHAAWINLRAMFVYGADFFVLKPGLVLFGVGLLLTLPMTFGRLAVGPVTFSLYWSLLGLTVSVLGMQSFFFGCLAQVLADYTGKARRRWSRVFPYTRTVLISTATGVTGMGFASTLVVKYLEDGLRLSAPDDVTYHLAITGLLLMILGFSLFIFTLVLHATAVTYGPSGQRGEAFN